MKLFYFVLIIILIYIFYKLERRYDIKSVLYPELYKNIVINDTDKYVNKKIVMCCLARNNEDIIQKTIDRFRYIGGHFNDYHIVIFENDSSDNTRQIIKNNTGDDLTLIDCPNDCRFNIRRMYDIGEKSLERFQKMAFFRQQYLNYVKEHFSNWDYMMVYDSDIKGCMDLTAFLDFFDIEREWDAFCVNGVTSLLDITYDPVAFKDLGKTEVPYNFINDIVNLNLKKHKDYIASGFNGCAVYKMNGVVKSNYMYPNIKSCEHLLFNYNFKRFMFNKKCKLHVGQQGDSIKLFKII